MSIPEQSSNAAKPQRPRIFPPPAASTGPAFQKENGPFVERWSEGAPIGPISLPSSKFRSRLKKTDLEPLSFRPDELKIEFTGV